MPHGLLCRPMAPVVVGVLLAWLWLPGVARADLTLEDTARLARQQAPSLLAQQHQVAGAESARIAAGTLPDPRLTLGVDNLPIGGADRFSLTRDFMTMQRIGLVQEVPNRAKRDAQRVAAQAREERDRAMLVVAERAVTREASLAWLAVYFAERRAAQLAALIDENRLLLDTLAARITSGKAMPVDRTMAQQESLALADRRDDLNRDIARARAGLRRWVGSRADEALAGDPPAAPVPAERLRNDMHRHVDIVPFVAQRDLAQAEASEARAELRGDWGWELMYSRRGPQFGDMVSFQFMFDIPWQRQQRQTPMLAAKLEEVERIDADREDAVRRHSEELDGQLAELQALDRQRSRLSEQGLPLAAERVALTLAGYQAGRTDLAPVLAARRDAIEARLRLVDLDAQRMALRVRLNTLIAE